jgi:tetratricopeptide (TPR) repeat protein
VQFLTETGIVGVGLFAAAALTIVLLARRRSDAELALWLVLPAYLLHGMLDVDWDFAAITAPVFLVGGALVARAPPQRQGFSFAKGLAASGVGIAVVVSLFTVWLADRYANEAALARSPAHAITLAKRARTLNPLSVDPIFTQALAEEQRKRPGRAYGLFFKATRVQPENPETWYALGEFELGIGCAHRALARFEHFYRLNPQDPGVAEKDKALKLVNSGKPRC